MLEVSKTTLQDGHIPEQTTSYSAESETENSTEAVNSSATSHQPATEHTEDRLYMIRQRNRRIRLHTIRQQILRSLGWTEPPKININSADTLRLILDEYEIPQTDEFTDERRCFSASCNLPRNVDQALWEDEETRGYRLYTGGSSRLSNHRTNLQSAHLKLYLLHNEGFTCRGEEINNSTPQNSRYLVQVYQFLRPLRIQRSRGGRLLNRKRLIDAKMVSTQSNTWVSVNVESAVSEWLSGTRHNFGFEIVVKDENETECNARQLFVPVDCNSPLETGCREENPEDLSPFPGLDDNTDENYPYLEVVSRVRINQRSGSSSSSRPRRSVKRSITSTEHGTVQQILDYLPTCKGTKIVKHIKEYWIIAPSRFITLRCSSTCSWWNRWTQRFVRSKRCHPVSTRPIQGFYLDKNRHLVYGKLPYEQVLQCGC